MAGTPHYFKVTPPRFEKPACEEHAEEFFSVDDERTGTRTEGYHEARRREHRARRLCQGCPFQLDCALHGLEFEEFGVWGGLTERDRIALDGSGHRVAEVQTTTRHTVRYLAEAGFTVEQIRALFTAWNRRKRSTKEDAGERGAA